VAEDNPQGQVHYIHRLSYTARERLVGAFVLAAIALVFLMLVFNKQTARLFEKKFVLHAYMHNAQGISTDTHVFVSGLDVGSVSGLELSPDNRIGVSMEILEKFHKLIRTDSAAELSKLSVLGNSAIDIKAGSPDKPPIENDATIPLAEPLSMDQVMSQVTPVLEDVKTTLARIDQLSKSIDPHDVSQTLQNLNAVTANLKLITGQVSSGQGAAGKLIFDKDTAANTTAAVQALADTLKETRARLAEIQPLLKNANAASSDMPALVSQSRKLVTQLNTTMGTVNYQLQALPDVVTRTRQILDDTDATLEAIQNTWPISSSVAKKPNTTLTPVQPPND
jgi:phospholipid/cholesterol/gamma-HCH transport system substrate-binding protein